MLPTHTIRMVTSRNTNGRSAMGTTETGRVVGHAYLRSGSYNLTLTITDNDGNSSAFSQTITVISRHDPREWEPRRDTTSFLEFPSRYDQVLISNLRVQAAGPSGQKISLS